MTKTKALWTCSFILSLLKSFDLLSYGSESRKRYTLRLLFMSLESLVEGFSGEELEKTMVSSKAAPVDLNVFVQCNCKSNIQI